MKPDEWAKLQRDDAKARIDQLPADENGNIDLVGMLASTRGWLLPAPKEYMRIQFGKHKYTIRRDA